ncbi:hypothetical protein LguiB_033734 [Lonicera macranthoides]
MSTSNKSKSPLLKKAFYNGAIGFRWDRQWLIVNSKGRAYTQRVEPKLALVEVKLPNEAFSEAWEPSNNSFLVISAPRMEELKVSLSKPREILDDVSLWEWCGSALYEGDEASKWFSDFLSKPSRLVCFNHGTLQFSAAQLKICLYKRDKIV